MKKLTLILLIPILLSGCLGASTRNTTIPLDNKITLSGFVYDFITGNGIPSATIEIQAEGTPIKSITTDENGRFSTSLYTTRTLITLDISHHQYWSHIGYIPIHYSSTEGIEYHLHATSDDPLVVNGYINYARPDIQTSTSVQAFHSLSMADSTEDMLPDMIIDEILVYADQIDVTTAKQLMQELGAVKYQLKPILEGIILTTNHPERIEDFLADALAHPSVSDAVINYPIVSLGTQPNDPFYAHQWNLPSIYLPQAWNVTKGSRIVTVAVLDSGIDQNHPDLQINIDYDNAYNVQNGSTDVHDPGGVESSPMSHGTHVTGIIGATSNNNQGIAGIAWDVSVVPIKVLAYNSRGNLAGSLADLEAGMKQAIKLGVDIINLSLGFPTEPSNPYGLNLYDLIRQATKQGITVVAAAGNGGKLLYPAKYQEVIAVGATTKNYTVASYSAVEDVWLFAPGGDRWSTNSIYSTDIGGYSYAAGTSMAAPHIAGVIALVKSTAAESPQEIRKLLWETGMEFDPTQQGKRLVNAYAAVTQAYIEDTQLSFTRVDDPNQTFVARGQITDRYFSVYLPEGDYILSAHLDTNNNLLLDAGDWYWQQPITVTPANNEQKLLIELDLF